MRELTAQMKAVAGVVREHVSKVFSELSNRIENIEGAIQKLPDISAESLAKQAAILVLQDLPAPKAGENGKDADPDLIQQLVIDAVAALPAPVNGEDGKSVSVQDVVPLLERLVEEKMQALPVPQAGQNGKDADPEVIQQLVAEAVAALPAPAKGENGKSISVDDVTPLLEQLVHEKIKQLPAAKDGESIPLEHVQRMVDDAVASALKNIPAAEDGEPGRDAAHLEILPAIDLEKSYARGTFATHMGGLFRSFEKTFGMKGWECIVDGIAAVDVETESDRNFVLQVTRSSGAVDRKSILSSQMIYRGIFSPGDYLPGDAVTWCGAMWHCNEATSDKPGELGSKGWTLCVKKGRDGKDGTNGRDLTKGVSL